MTGSGEPPRPDERSSPSFDRLIHEAFRLEPTAVPEAPSIAAAVREALESTAVRPKPGDAGAPPAGSSSRGLSRYRLAEEVGRGGVGVIVRAHDLELNRSIAIKILSEQYSQDPAMVQRFVEEAQIGGQLQHPGIVPVHETGFDERGRPYFTMKLVKGRTLAELLRERPDPTADRRRLYGIFEKICDTVAYAHGRGVVHRDLKPANVMVGAFGEVQVMDWGLAKVLSEDTEPDATLPDMSADTVIETVRTRAGDHSVTGALMGTPSYMAPEQARGAVADLDARTDVFSLGAILCEMLTGRGPYSATTFVERVQEAQRGDLAEAHARLRASGAEREVVDLAVRCLTAKREARPASAAEVAESFNAFLASVEARLRAAESAAARARARAFAGISLAVACVLVGVTYWIVEQNRTARARKAAAGLDAATERVRASFDAARARPVADASGWPVALSDAAHAATLADAEEIDPTRAAATARLVARVRSAAAEATRRAEIVQRDNAMSERLDAIRERFDPFDYLARDEEYERAFLRYGIDVTAGDVEATAARVRSSRIASALCTALDEWQRVRHRGNLARDQKPTAELLRLLAATDTNSTRAEVRRCYFERDLAGLEKVVATIDPATAEPETIYAAGNALRFLGSQSAAAALLRRGLQHHAGDFWLNVQFAQLMLWVDVREALNHFTAARALRPSSPRPLAFIATCQRRLNRLAEAEATCRQAIALDDECADSYWSLAEVLHFRGREDESLDALKTAVRLRPNCASWHYWLGEALRAEDPEGAIEAYEAAIRMEPRHVPALMGLANVRSNTGELDAAAALLERVLKVGGTQSTSAQFARAHRGSGYDLDAEMTRALEALGILLRRKLYDLDRAVVIFRSVTERRPDDPVAYAQLAITLGLKDDYAGAMTYAKQGLECGEKPYWGCHSAHCLASERMGRYRDAIAHARKVVELAPKGFESMVSAFRRRAPSYRKRMAWAKDLIALQQGTATLADFDDLFAIAGVALEKGYTRTAAEYFRRGLSDGSTNWPRWRDVAIRAAGWAGSGVGRDADRPAAERASWRAQARQWMQESLDAWNAAADRDDQAMMERAHGCIRFWQQTVALAGLRDASALAAMTEEERAACARIWEAVDALLSRVEP